MSYNSLTTRRRDFDVTFDSNTYAGNLALPFLSPALKANDTIAKNYVRVLDGVHYKAVIPTGSSSDTIQAAGCDYVDGANLTLNEAVVTLTELQVGETICRGTVYPTWHGAATAMATTDYMTTEFKNFTLGLVAAKTAENLENLLWLSEATGGIYAQGFLSNDGAFDEDGFDAGVLAGANEVTIVSITAQNCISEFGKVYNATAVTKPGVLSKSDVGFYCGTKTAALYRQALATAGGGVSHIAATTVYTNGQGVGNNSTLQSFEELNYLGVPIRVCPGIPADCIIVANQENLVVANNLGTDLSSVRWIPAYEYDGSDNIKVIMRMAVGATVGIVGDVFVGATFWT